MLALRPAPARRKMVCRGVEEACPPGKVEKFLAQFENMRAAGFTDRPRAALDTPGRLTRAGSVSSSGPTAGCSAWSSAPNPTPLPGLDLLSLEFLSLRPAG